MKKFMKRAAVAAVLMAAGALALLGYGAKQAAQTGESELKSV